jgi:hypothetical protein
MLIDIDVGIFICVFLDRVSLLFHIIDIREFGNLFRFMMSWTLLLNSDNK